LALSPLAHRERERERERKGRSERYIRRDREKKKIDREGEREITSIREKVR
jgi:hypothetical protein